MEKQEAVHKLMFARDLLNEVLGKADLRKVPEKLAVRVAAGELVDLLAAWTEIEWDAPKVKTT